ncbi:MAG TPA: anti-sigma factor domain-containing protein, partial [Bacillales bacterium]
LKRGIVMEVKRRKAVVLTENGRFETIRLPKGTTPGVGDKIAVSVQERGVAGRRKPNGWFPAMSTIAAALIFVVLLGGFYTANPNETIAAYVSYDVNPSFSAAVNGDMQVVSVQTWNQDAAMLFAEWDSYRFMELKSFSRLVVEKIAKSGYFNGDSHFLIATTVVLQDQNERDRVAASLRKVVDSIRSNELLSGKSVAVTVKTADPQTRKKANANGLSLGKYLLYLNADDHGEDLSIDTVKQSSVAEIEHKMQNTPEADAVPEAETKTDVAEGRPKVPGRPSDNGNHYGQQKAKPDKEHRDNGKHKGWNKAKPDHKKAKQSRHADKKGKDKEKRPHSPAAKNRPGIKHDGGKKRGNPHQDKKDRHLDKHSKAHHKKSPKPKSPGKEKKKKPDHKELRLNIHLPDLGFKKEFIKREVGSLHIVIEFDKKAE